MSLEWSMKALLNIHVLLSSICLVKHVVQLQEKREGSIIYARLILSFADDEAIVFARTTLRLALTRFMTPWMELARKLPELDFIVRR